MFAHDMLRAMWGSRALGMLLLVIAATGCTGWERAQHRYENTPVVADQACRVCPTAMTGPPLDWLGGYHLTHWHSIEPTVIQPGVGGVFLPSPALIPQEEVPIPEPSGEGVHGEEERPGESVLPGALPGERSSTVPTRDSRLTQTAWPAAISSGVPGVVRLPAVVTHRTATGTNWLPSSVARGAAGSNRTHDMPTWWRHGPLVTSSADLRKRGTGLPPER